MRERFPGGVVLLRSIFFLFLLVLESGNQATTAPTPTPLAAFLLPFLFPFFTRGSRERFLHCIAASRRNGN
ncbi:hypothetical protein BRADI_2g27365v3 [Brachypodium distachyon]|uniref:Secreted protein n=1 Tax=Brachypodium distachyon TaxID=15368 RepID=A0A2K2DAW4_BRADI|nr:hypothetical protein BRADI_2g27365v3 [Brachypodium distachyon]